MYSATTTDVSVGTVLNIPWWTLCIFSALISLTAGVSRLNYPDINKEQEWETGWILAVIMILNLCYIRLHNNTFHLLMGPPYCPCSVAVWKQCKRHGKRREEWATRIQIKLSRSSEQKHTALEGKPLEEGSMPSSVVMSLDAGQMSGLLLVSANRQTDRTIVTRGHVFRRGCPMGKNWTQHGLASAKACRSSPVCLACWVS